MHFTRSQASIHAANTLLQANNGGDYSAIQVLEQIRREHRKASSTKPLTDTTSKTAHPVYCVLYYAGSVARPLAAPRICRILFNVLTESAIVLCHRLMALARKKDVFVRSFLDGRKMNTIHIRDCYLLVAWRHLYTYCVNCQSP